MDQKKIGSFLKQLRNEKNITQEQLSEILYVSSRTISRWETGSNMPDLSILIQIADYYDVEVNEILDGERKSEKTRQDMKGLVIKVADYSNDGQNKFTKRLCYIFSIGLFTFTVYLVMEYLGIADTMMDGAPAGALLGFSYGTMIVAVLYTSGYLMKIKSKKIQLLQQLHK